MKLMLAAALLATSFSAQMKPAPVWDNLSGSQATIWAEASLQDLGVPITPANIETMRLWFRNEGVPHDLNNPLNLQTYYDHSYTSTANGDPAWIHIQAYRYPQDFPHAFGREMRHDGPDNGSYYYLIQALRSGRGFVNNHTRGVEHDLAVYSGGGYRTVPAWYCPC
jgi:hypothetical protein